MTTPDDTEAFRAFERDAHDEVAIGYRDFFATVTAYAIEPLLDAARVRAGSCVLDVACGPGQLASRAAKRGASRVVGVDLAPRVVALAAEQYPEVSFRVADAEALPFADRTFDAVTSSFGIGHFPRPEQAVAEFMRVLRPDGFVALSWWDVPERHRLNGIFFDAFNAAGGVPPADLPVGPPLFRFSDDGELAQLMRSSGLVDVRVDTHALIHRLPSSKALWDGILGGTVRTSIAIRRQPSDVQQRIHAAFERLIEPYRTPDGLRMPVAFKIAAGRRAPAASGTIVA